jgi:hypothetical protein
MFGIWFGFILALVSCSLFTCTCPLRLWVGNGFLKVLLSFSKHRQGMKRKEKKRKERKEEEGE